MKNLPILQFFGVLTIAVFLIILAGCNPDPGDGGEDCPIDPISCSFPDTVILDSTFSDWVARFDSIFEGAPLSRYNCPRESLRTFVEDYAAFRVYFGLADQSDLSSFRLVSTHIQGDECSDYPEDDPDLFYWGGAETPIAETLTANWRSKMGVSLCDNLGVAPGELFMDIPLAFTFNSDSARKDFLDDPLYDQVYAFLGVEKKMVVGEDPTFHLRLILQGEDNIVINGSQLLDRATPCPYICGKKNNLQDN